MNSNYSLDCTIEDIEYEENAAPPLHTLVFQSIINKILLIIRDFIIISFCLPSTCLLFINSIEINSFLLVLTYYTIGLACKSMTFEEGCMSEGNYLEISGMFLKKKNRITYRL